MRKKSSPKTVSGNGNGTSHKPRVCIIGPGVVGLATGKGFLTKGFTVGFMGRNKEKMEKLQKDGLHAFTAKEALRTSYDYDVSMLTIPTPTENGKINLSRLVEAATTLGKLIAKKDGYHVIVVKSTVPPGTTEDIVIPIVEYFSGKKAGLDFGVCMNPEYLREKTAYEDFIHSWVVVIGEYDKKSGDVIAQLYKNFSCPMYRVSIKEAEMQKYVHNVFNATKISYFNEIRELCKRVNINPEKIFSITAISSEGIWNPKYGLKDRGPFDGSCLPKDTEALLEFAQKHDFVMHILSSVVFFNKLLLNKKENTQEKYYQVTA